jgi:hypothetical protein
MFRSGVVLKLALLAILALPVSLAAQVTASRYSYQPHYLSSLQDAANQLQSLSPRFAPALTGDKFSLTKGYSLVWMDVNKQGMKLLFSKTSAQQTQFYWSWNDVSTAPPYAPNTGDIVTSIVFASIGQFATLNIIQFDGTSSSSYPAAWCIQPDNQPPGGNRILCIDTQEDAQKLVDALSTMVVASGGDLVPNDGFGDVNAIAADYLTKFPNETGGTIASVVPWDPPAQAGIQGGDILHAVNGKPYVARQGMVTNAVKEATWHKPGGGVVHVDIFRNHTPKSIDIHYSKPQVNAEALQHQDIVPPQSGATPASGVHFGFQVRPVLQDDIAPLALTSTRGLVVVSVENGSLADTMGILAGDLILQVNGADAGDTQHFSQLIHSGAVRSFRVWRKGQTVELAVPVSM